MLAAPLLRLRTKEEERIFAKKKEGYRKTHYWIKIAKVGSSHLFSSNPFELPSAVFLEEQVCVRNQLSSSCETLPQPQTFATYETYVNVRRRRKDRVEQHLIVPSPPPSRLPLPGFLVLATMQGPHSTFSTSATWCAESSTHSNCSTD